MTSYCRSVANYAAHQRPTVGDIKISYTVHNHLGWIKCDGSSLSTTEFKLLFDVIGYTYGGSGDSFNLPDAAGRVVGVTGTPSGLSSPYGTAHAIGSTTGEEVHLLTINEMPAHTHGSSNVSGNSNGDGFTTSNGSHAHSITDPGHTHSYVNQPNSHQVAVSATTTGTADDVNVNQTTDSNTTGITINSNGLHNHQIYNTGGSNVHNNMQPTLFAGNMFIYSGRVQYGTFPYTENKDVA